MKTHTRHEYTGFQKVGAQVAHRLTTGHDRERNALAIVAVAEDESRSLAVFMDAAGARKMAAHFLDMAEEIEHFAEKETMQ